MTFTNSQFKSTVKAAQLIPIPAVTKFSDRVTRFLGMNPSPMTLQGTNTYLVGTGKRRLLIDTGDGLNSDYVENLKKSLDELKAEISQVIMTHWHHDHVGGYDAIRKISSDDCKFYKYRCQDKHLEEKGKYVFIENSHRFSVEGANLKTVYTPGHSTDHIVLVLEEENILFSGDCILGEGTAVFEDLYDYMKSLHKILDLKASKIYPAHGNVIENPVIHIGEYIKHRNHRESQIVECLKLEKLMKVAEIVNKIYEEAENNPVLEAAAGKNVCNHLSKLVKEGIVEQVDNDTFKIK